MEKIILKKMDDYIKQRDEIVSAREGFFNVLRNFLSQQKNGEGQQVSARSVADADWIMNSDKGYFMIKEDKDAGRDFRVSILQMGNVLRIGTRMSMESLTRNPSALERISNIYPNKPPVQRRLTSGEVMFDWNFDVADLYCSILSMETAVFQVSTLFENLLFATIKQNEKTNNNLTRKGEI